MERARFDFLTRTLAASSNRRTALKGISGVVAGSLFAHHHADDMEAAWSTLVCLPVGSEVTARLVPTASVPFYVQRYGAVVAENGGCPVCLTTAQCPLFTTCSGGACVDPCTLIDCSCSIWPPASCLRYADGTADCTGEYWEQMCSETMANCTSDDVCPTDGDYRFRCAIAENGPGFECEGVPNTCQFTIPVVC